MKDHGNVTEILGWMSEGDRQAFDDLLPLVYRELRSLAANHMRRERRAVTLQATALAHEAYLRLLGGAIPALEDRAGFFAVAARAMRQILVEQARARGRQKRGGGWQRITLGPSLAAAQHSELDILALEEALTRLALKHPRRARVVELLYFGGLSAKEAAWVLGITSRTIERDWRSARTWLLREILGPVDEAAEAESDRAGRLVLPDPHPPAPPSSIGPYRVVREIGRGGMGVVYEVEDRRLRCRVALKLLPSSLAQNPRWRNAMHREAQLLGAIDHPNVAKIHTFEESGDAVFLTLELLSGDTLADRIADGALSPTEALAIAGQIAAALEMMHANDIIHGDLKPANVSVAPDGICKVLDFGLARFRGPGSGTQLPDRGTDRGWIAGTPGYMSPEQIRGAPTLPSADVWAFGVLLYECFTGCAAFLGDSTAERNQASLRRDPDWSQLADETPDGLLPLLTSCLMKDAAARLQTVTEVRIQLESLVAAVSGRRELGQDSGLEPEPTPGQDRGPDPGREPGPDSNELSGNISPASAQRRSQTPSGSSVLQRNLNSICRLLSPHEEQLFRRLAVFKAGWTLAAAAQVCFDDGDTDRVDVPVDPSRSLVADGPERPLWAKSHQQLFDHGLIERDPGPHAVTDEVRFRLSAIARPRARQRLQRSGESKRLRERYVTHYARLAEEVVPKLSGSEQSRWIAILDAERSNFVGALDTALRPHGPYPVGLSLVVALERYWTNRGFLEEGRKYTEAFLRRSGPANETRVHALIAAGNWQLYAWNLSSARRRYEKALEVAEEIESRETMARALHNIGGVALQSGDLKEARLYFTKNLAMVREDGDLAAVGRVLSNLGVVAEREEDGVRAEDNYRQALEIFRGLNDQRLVAVLLSNLGSIFLQRADASGSLSYFEKSLEIFRQLDDRSGVAATLGGYGIVLQSLGELPRALATLQESLGISSDLHDWHGIWKQIVQSGILFWQAGQPRVATRFLAAAHSIRESFGTPYPQSHREQIEEHLAELRRVLSDSDFRAAWEGGASLSPAEAASEVRNAKVVLEP